MHRIRRGLLALVVCSGAATSVAAAQDSTAKDSIAKDSTAKVVPPAPLVTSGIETGPLQSGAVVVSLPNASCPLTSSQLTAVRTGVGTSFVGVNAYLYHYFKQAWWSGVRAPHFFFRADWDQEFRDQDKFGHMLGGFHLARVGYAGLRAACVGRKKAIFWSAAYAAAFQLQIEIFDGQFVKYGFSYADMIANTTGQTLAVMQELYPSLRAIKPTVSYHKTRALANTENGQIPGELRPSL
ncbi:MAG TPA: DUF2279 domain-containing protein, partial [Gemmatimonadaceae bacterium]